MTHYLTSRTASWLMAVALAVGLLGALALTQPADAAGVSPDAPDTAAVDVAETLGAAPWLAPESLPALSWAASQRFWLRQDLDFGFWQWLKDLFIIPDAEPLPEGCDSYRYCITSNG